MGIRVAAMSLLWNNPHGEQFAPWLREVKACGYEGVAGFADWGWTDYLPQPAHFQQMLDGEGLALASLDMFIPADLGHVCDVCAFMAACGARHLVCLGGVGKTEQDFQALADHLNQIGSIALEYDVHAVYHHHTGNTGETFTEIQRLLALTDVSQFFVMLDTGHATKDFIELPVAERAVAFLRRYGKQLDFLELKDWNPETDLNTPLGEGGCDFATVFSLLREYQYAGWITVEQNGHAGLSRGRQPAACAAISRQLIRKGLGV